MDETPMLNLQHHAPFIFSFRHGRQAQYADHNDNTTNHG
jgi:hypothetical protein